MASKSSVWVTKEEIRTEFKGKTATLDNAIHALTTKNLIVQKEGTKGTYRLLHKGFALWIKFFTSGPETVK
jgi:predicted transcriptional regulator